MVNLANSGHEQVLILVKALPHVGQRRGETVCCAGLTLEGKWRRQYPIHFRRLQDQFKRWQWIEYDWIGAGPEDLRIESRRVQEDTIKLGKLMPKHERAHFLANTIMPSTNKAAANGMSLTLIRPNQSHFSWKAKTRKQIVEERHAYEAAAQQKSFLDPDLIALMPCPYAFYFDWTDSEGTSHRSTCDDWETAAMYYRREKNVGPEQALQEMDQIFNYRYPAKGMTFAMGTHSRRADQWLLVGVIRLNDISQFSLEI